MPDLDPRLIATIIVLAVMLLVGFPIHEFAHALAAYRLGDGTAKLFGRLTLNPVVHFDPLGGLILVVTALTTGLMFGWAKPTPVNPMNLQGGRRGEAIVALAGPLSNIVLAAAGAIPLRFIIATQMVVPELLLNILQFFVLINIVLAVFNLLPVPPLDGSKVLFGFLDPRTEMRIRPFLERYGFLILLVLILPIFGGRSLIAPVILGVVGEIFGFLVGV